MAVKSFPIDSFLTLLYILGYQDDDYVYLREFAGKQAKPEEFKAAGLEFKDYFKNVYPDKECIKFSELKRLETYGHASSRGLYFVVNGQGQKKENIKFGRAIFVEHDVKHGLTKEDQLTLWQKLGLPEPSAQVETRNSIHQYWVFDELIPIEIWQNLQNAAIAKTGSDISNKDASRVFRVPGAYHIQKNLHGEDEPEFICNLVSQAGHSYSLEVLQEAFKAEPVLAIPVAQDVEVQAKSISIDEFETVNSTSQIKKSNEVNLADFLHNEVLPRHTPESLFKWREHHFKYYNNNTKVKGYCPWHESTSGTSWYADLKDGIWNLWRCPACGFGGGAIQYRARLNNVSGNHNGTPSGKEWIDVLRELAEDVGLQLPACKPSDKKINEWIKQDKKFRDEQLKKSEPDSDDDANLSRVLYGNRIESRDGMLGVYVLIDKFTQEEDGSWKKTKKAEFKPFANFDFDVINIFQDDFQQNNGGFLLEIKAVDNEPKTILLLNKDKHRLDTLTAQLEKAYGSNLAPQFTLNQFNQILQEKTKIYLENGGKRDRLAPFIGLQDNGYWIFKDKQFAPDGTECSSKESGLVFNYHQTIEGDQIPNPIILEQDPNKLEEILLATRKYVGETLIFPTLFVVAAQVMGLFYPRIKEDGYTIFPFVNATGDPGSGKSTAMTLAQWFVGLEGKSMSSASESAIYERSKNLSGLSLTWDDPKRENNKDIDELFKALSSGDDRSRRGNVQKPRGGVIVASNHAIGEDKNAVISRCIRIPFYVTKDFDKHKTRRTFSKLQRTASAAFGSLIRMGYDSDAVYELTEELEEYLPKAHSRMANNLALITFYALKLGKIAGLSEESIKEYVKNVLCQSANQSESNKPSHLDFIDKCLTLVSQSKLGDWNFKVHKLTDRDGIERKVVSIKMASVWPVFYKHYRENISYSRKIVEELIQASTKDTDNRFNDVQKFAEDEDKWREYKRKELDKECEEKYIKPAFKPYRCVTIFLPDDHELLIDDKPVESQSIYESKSVSEAKSKPILKPKEPVKQTEDNPPKEQVKKVEIKENNLPEQLPENTPKIESEINLPEKKLDVKPEIKPVSEIPIPEVKQTETPPENTTKQTKFLLGEKVKVINGGHRIFVITKIGDEKDNAECGWSAREKQIQHYLLENISDKEDHWWYSEEQIIDVA